MENDNKKEILKYDDNINDSNKKEDPKKDNDDSIKDKDDLIKDKSVINLVSQCWSSVDLSDSHFSLTAMRPCISKSAPSISK